MKRIITLILTVFVVVSYMTGAVCAMNYSDLRSTSLHAADSVHYINYDDDDRLQMRANCYGFAMRLHYLENSLPYGFVGQIPGEFYDRSESGTTFYGLITGAYSKTVMSVIAKVMKDCQELGYSLTTLAVDNSTTYVPPSSSTEPNKRLIALVGKSDEVDDFHFLVQTEGDTWTQKYAEDAATGNCIYHTNVALTNDNISQHVRCCKYGKTFGSSVIYFYVDSPGTTDRGHYYHSNESTQTLVRMYEGHGQSPNLFECAGNFLISSETFNNASSILRTGYINHLEDVDYYVFNVAETGYYSISIYTNTKYDIRMRFLDVTNVSANVNINSGNSYLTGDNGYVTFNVQLTAGRRYCMKVYSTNQTQHEQDRSYVISINN